MNNGTKVLEEAAVILATIRGEYHTGVQVPNSLEAA